MNPYMNKKYQILQQQADQAGRLSGSQASHIDAETSELPANAKATRAAQYGAADASAGQAYHARAAADVARANIPYIGPLANSEIQQRAAAAGLAGAQASSTSRMADLDFSPLSSRMGANPGGPIGGTAGFYNTGAPPAPPAPRSVTSLPMDAAPSTGASGGFDDGSSGFNPNFKPLTGGFAAGTSNFEGPHDHHIRALGAALGFKPAPQPAPQPAVPGHAAGISDVGGDTASVGGRLQQGGQAVGTPGYSANMQTHAIADNSTGQPMNFPPVGGQQVAGYAAGTSNTQDDQGMQPNPSGAPLGAAGGSPAPVGQTGATSWGGVGMPVPEPKSFKKGTDKVGGKGSGKVDTQPAMLAPGEAVLNKAAAEHLGRDTIDLLNAAGAQKMGLDQQPNQPAAVPVSQAGAKEPGYAAGTSNFPPKKGAPGAPAKGGKVPPPAKGKEANGKAPAKTAAPANKAPAPAAKAAKSVPGSKGKGAPAPAAKSGGGVSPALVQALAGMMGGGGGMPAPGGPAPMMGAPAPQPMGPPQLPGLGLR